MKKDPSGLTPGDFFDTAEEAAQDAIDFINPKSVAEFREYSGEIKKFGKGFMATSPRPGPLLEGLKATRPSGAPLIVRSNDYQVGNYHTHGDHVKKGKDGNLTRATKDDEMRSDADEISEADKVNARNALALIPGYKSYVGGPSGQVRQYDPATDFVRVCETRTSCTRKE